MRLFGQLPRFAALPLALMMALVSASTARAAGPTPGYPEAVVQWGVQKGDTCEDIAKALYGSAKHVPLIGRYNRVACAPGAPLREGMTLVLPEKVTVIPDARMRSLNPDVRARPGGGAWGPASPGMPLYSSANVNTLDRGRADIEFVDRTRVFLAPNTLVVIYGTANQSRVAKTPPVAVEVESGEVKAGLAALRGEAVEVAIKDGGRVSAASRDTVIERKGDRTTVAVFDGKAGVTAAGKAVLVPKNFGTRFVGAAPPIPPRPLPPPPAWAKGGTAPIALAPAGAGILDVAWEPVPVAITYRIEVSRDDGYNDLVVREEVPAAIHAFHAEKMPAGTYHLRVRAIDKEEYLGIASPDRLIRLVASSLDGGGGAVKSHEIEANPYGLLRFVPFPEIEMSLDDGPYGPVPERLDLEKRAPKVIRLRPRGGGESEVLTVRYTEVHAAIRAATDMARRTIEVRVTLSGLEGIDADARVAPMVRLREPSRPAVEVRPLAKLSAGEFAAVLPLSGEPGKARVDVVDARGAVLGTAEIEFARPPPPMPSQPPPPMPVIGLSAPLWGSSPITDALFLSPTAPAAVDVSAGLTRVNGALAVTGQARASGSLGPVGLDAAIRSNTAGEGARAASAWFGVRARVFRLGQAAFEVAPSLRLGFPAVAEGPTPRLEIGVLTGGAAGRVTFIADAGLRARLASEPAGAASPIPKVQAFVLAGATFAPVPWLRIAAFADGHVVHPDTGDNAGLLGLGGSVEAGRTIFGAFSLRGTPTPAAGEGPFSAQIAVGIREVSR
jgi:FecR protein